MSISHNNSQFISSSEVIRSNNLLGLVKPFFSNALKFLLGVSSSQTKNSGKSKLKFSLAFKAPAQSPKNFPQYTWIGLSRTASSSGSGHYDEPEILSYAIPLICSIGADVRQFGKFIRCFPKRIVGQVCVSLSSDSQNSHPMIQTMMTVARKDWLFDNHVQRWFGYYWWIVFTQFLRFKKLHRLCFRQSHGILNSPRHSPLRPVLASASSLTYSVE